VIFSVYPLASLQSFLEHDHCLIHAADTDVGSGQGMREALGLVGFMGSIPGTSDFAQESCGLFGTPTLVI
jgi:hypothetical protein